MPVASSSVRQLRKPAGELIEQNSPDFLKFASWGTHSSGEFQIHLVSSNLPVKESSSSIGWTKHCKFTWFPHLVSSNLPVEEPSRWICNFSFNLRINSSSWLATAKQVADEGMAHCHLAIYSKVLNVDQSKQAFHNDELIQMYPQHLSWAPETHQLVRSLDSPVLVLDTVPKASDARVLEPKTRWILINHLKEHLCQGTACLRLLKGFALVLWPSFLLSKRFRPLSTSFKSPCAARGLLAPISASSSSSLPPPPLNTFPTPPWPPSILPRCSTLWGGTTVFPFIVCIPSRELYSRSTQQTRIFSPLLCRWNHSIGKG